MLTTAICRPSSWSRRSRRTSSSVSELLPAPPVPVMPITGVRIAFAASCSSRFKGAAILPFSSAVIACASARRAAPGPRIAANVAGA